MKKGKTILMVTAAIFFLSSCSTSQMASKSATTFIELKKADLELSKRATAEATEVRILGINFGGMINRESGNFNSDGYALRNSIPIIGESHNPTRVQNNALYKLLKSNEDFDFVMYPRFEEKTKKVLFFYKRTETKVSARLAKL